MSDDAAFKRNPVNRWLPYCLGLGLILLAFTFQYQHTANLDALAEEDLYRDLGSANSFLHGYSSQDPQLLHETRWYNPLIPYLIAKLSLLSGSSVYTLYSHAGIYLNLLAPLVLLVWVGRLGSAWAGCFAVCAYLFMGSHDVPSWKFATYSPWLWPFNFTQGLTLLTLLALQLGIKSNQLRYFAGAGILLGLTFLSHTAPAAIIALTFTLVCMYQAWSREWTLREALIRISLTGGLSFLLAMILIWPLFVSYGMRMQNPAPADFTGLFKNEVITINLTVKTAIAGAFFLAVLYRLLMTRKLNPALTLFLAFTGTSAALFLYGLVVDIVRAKGWINLPLLVPSFHFHLYLYLCLTVAFGLALDWAITRLRPEALKVGAGSAGIVALVAISWPGYSHNHDTLKFSRDARDLGAQTTLRQLYDWCLSSTRPDDVFLADDYYGQYSIGAAARKVLVLDPIFTSPYVDADKRIADRQALYQALQTGDHARFTELADRYHIRYILTAPDMLFGLYSESPVNTNTIARAGLEEVKTFGDLHVYRR